MFWVSGDVRVLLYINIYIYIYIGYIIRLFYIDVPMSCEKKIKDVYHENVISLRTKIKYPF